MFASEISITHWVGLGVLALAGAVWLYRHMHGYSAPTVSDITPQVEGRNTPGPDSWAERAVSSMGFTYCGDYVCDYGEPRARRYLAYLSPDWTHWALLVSAVEDRGRVRHAEFVTDFDIEIQLVSTTRGVSGPILASRRCFRVSRPGMASLRALFRVHQQFCLVLSDADAAPLRVRPRDFRKWLRDTRENVAEELVRRGFLRLEDDVAEVRLSGVVRALPALAWRGIRFGLFLWLPALPFLERHRLRRLIARTVSEREAEWSREGDDRALGGAWDD